MLSINWAKIVVSNVEILIYSDNDFASTLLVLPQTNFIMIYLSLTTSKVHCTYIQLNITFHKVFVYIY